MEKWMKNGTFGEKRWKNGRKNGRKTALFFTKIQSPVSGVEKWGEIEVSGGLRKIGDFIGLLYEQDHEIRVSSVRPSGSSLFYIGKTATSQSSRRSSLKRPILYRQDPKM